MNHLIQPVLRPVSRWAERSQQRACRNAMVASASVSAGRRERDEVHEYVVSLLARRDAAVADGSDRGHAAGLG